MRVFIYTAIPRPLEEEFLIWTNHPHRQSLMSGTTVDQKPLNRIQFRRYMDDIELWTDQNGPTKVLTVAIGSEGLSCDLAGWIDFIKFYQTIGFHLVLAWDLLEKNQPSHFRGTLSKQDL